MFPCGTPPANLTHVLAQERGKFQLYEAASVGFVESWVCWFSGKTDRELGRRITSNQQKS